MLVFTEQHLDATRLNSESGPSTHKIDIRGHTTTES